VAPEHVPLHILALKAQLVVLVSAFVMVSTVWSVSCLLFSYSQCPSCSAICKSWGARAPRAPWSRRHCSLPDHAVTRMYVKRGLDALLRLLFVYGPTDQYHFMLSLNLSVNTLCLKKRPSPFIIWITRRIINQCNNFGVQISRENFT